jgi:hypothetical protein
MGNGCANFAPRVRYMGKALERLARVSYTFVVMNYAAVAGLFSLIRRDPLIWR